MSAIINWIEAVFGLLPLPLLEVWGRFAYIVGLAFAISAFGGFTYRPGGRWGFGRERQAWDAKAVLSIPVTFILIVVAGYLGSFIVLVPGAQTFESLKDLMVFLCIVLFGYPALIAVPFAYGLSDLIEGVPPGFLLGWLPGYFINPSCFWVAYQLFGKNPDFRRARTWGKYLLFVLIFMGVEPVLWGYICSDKFTPAISFGNITPALFFTTGITWIIAPFAMLAALPVARKFGMFWAEIPGHVKERTLRRKQWVWEAGGNGARPGMAAATEGWPIRMILLTPFIAIVLLMVGATAYVTLRSAADDAHKLATRLHEEISDNINLQLDERLAQAPGPAVNADEISRLLAGLPVAQHGFAMIVSSAGNTVASSGKDGNPVAAKAVARLRQTPPSAAQLKEGFQFHFDHVTEKPLSREIWLARATAYQDRSGGHADWMVLTLMPESFYLAGVQAGNSRSAMVFALALLLSLAVAAFLAAVVTARLRRISLATQALAQGNLAERVPGSRLEELDTLAHSFNDMAGRLKKSFDDLHESRERYALAESAVNDGLWDWNIVTHEAYLSQRWKEILGYRDVQLPNHDSSFFSLVHPDDEALVSQSLREHIESRKRFAVEFRLQHRDGSYRWVLSRGEVIRNDGGQPVRMVGSITDITERKKDESALEERETFLRMAQEAAHVGSWEWDIATNHFKWSEELARIHGISGAEFDGEIETVMAFCHPQDRGRLREAMGRIGDGEDLGAFECRIIRRDGVERDLWFLGRTQRDGRGSPAKVLGIAIDITERKRTENALRRSEEQFRAVVEDQTEMIVRWKPDGTRTFVNQAYCRTFGKSCEELVGGSFFPLVAEPYREGIRRKMLSLTPESPLATEIHESHAPGGEMIWQEWTDRGLFDAAGRLVEVQSTGRNITERVIAERRIRRLNRTYAVLSGINELIVRQQEPHIIMEGACRIAAETGGFRLAWIGMLKDRGGPLELAAHSRATPDTVEVLGRVFDDPAVGCAFTKQALQTSRHAVCNDVTNDPLAGPWCSLAMERGYLSLVSLPLVVAEKCVGAFNLYAGEADFFDAEELRLLDELAADIGFALGVSQRETERQSLELQLRQSQKMEGIGQLAGGVAHDFNNILGAIMMQSELAEMEKDLSDDVRDGLREIRLAAERAATLTRQLLMFSRRQVMQPRQLDVNEVVTGLAKMLQRIIGEDIRMQLHLHPAPLVAFADAGMIDQILMNLSVNARDAMPEGGRLLIETVPQTVDDNLARLHPDASPGDYVRLSASDTGGGIPPEVLPRIFEPFFTTKEPGKGTGLGLATVFGIVKQHRGWIRVESEQGVGASFQIFIPMTAGSAAAVPSAPKSKPRGGTETILLVEDDEFVRVVTRALLERNGYRVVEAASGTEALALWPEHHREVALVLTDLVMPGGMRGQELARRVREEHPDIKIIFTSGYSADIAGRALELRDGENFVQKPCQPDHLLETVRRCLDG